MPRVAVVGCGDVSIVHFEAIEAIADAELVAVCDSDAATLTDGRRAVPGAGLRRPSPAAGRRCARTSCTSVRHMINTRTSRSTASAPGWRCCWRSRWPIPPAEGDRVVRGRGRARSQDRNLLPEPLQRHRASRSVRCSTPVNSVRYSAGLATCHVASAGGVLPGPALAGSMANQRRRGDDQPGHPHPGPVAVVPG